MSRPTSPSDEQRRQLRAFVRHVESMLQSRFFRNVQSMPTHTLSIEDIPDGSSVFTAPPYDREDFEAFLTRFRQVAMSDSEPVYFNRIRNIVSTFAGLEYEENLRCPP